MPGVLQVEALAQIGCIMLLDGHTEDISDKLVVFTGIKNARFRQQVVPGDQLIMEVELINFRRNFATMKGVAKVDDKVACELEASAAIIQKGAQRSEERRVGKECRSRRAQEHEKKKRKRGEERV